MGSEILRYYEYISPLKRQRMNFGHSRPAVRGTEIGERGGNIHTLLAIGDIKEVPAPDPEKPKALAKEVPRPEPLPVAPIIHEVETDPEFGEFDPNHKPAKKRGRPRKDHK